MALWAPMQRKGVSATKVGCVKQGLTFAIIYIKLFGKGNRLNDVLSLNEQNGAGMSQGKK